ncbi:outer membrane protein assembly factor BamB [Bowmanella yangjiangensis]|uniref:Outer membrane protein assembly factor BamB n=1 Tax=Bowmanella yangjiangensis TaxID=2811230 RepID=A0ABS3CR75_9ALTE|nr:outer membrane protein assembly factor BamB [Bowmanella yangjiangensis]
MIKPIRALCLLSVLGLSGCSILPQWMDPTTWFADEEELKIKELKPINAQFVPVTLWEEEVGDGVGSHFSRLKPAVAYDKVFAADRHGEVVAFDKTTGKQVWQRNFAQFDDSDWYSGVSRIWQSGESARIAGGMAASYEKVFFGTENGDVVALDANTGETKWHTKVKGEVLAKPAVSEGLVVVNTGAGIMFALDAESGEQKWLYESEVPPLSLRGISAPTVASGGAMVGTASGKLAVVIMENGQVAWEQAVTAPTGATELDRMVDIDVEPLILGGVIYVVSFDGTLAAVELRSGRVIWKREYRSYRRVTMDANNLYVVDADSVVYGLDRRNGVELWSQTSLRGRQLTAAEPVGDYLVVGDKFGYLHWLSQTGGELVARLEVGNNDEDEAIFAAPVVEGKVLYTLTRDGQLRAIQTP